MSNTVTDAAFRSGIVAVVGRPNVGKSSLLNCILQYRLSIVSAKPQTTRDNILGLYNARECQILFVDTPGIHKPVHKLGERLVERATEQLSDANVILYVVTANDWPDGAENSRIISMLARCAGRPIVLAVNKIDLPGARRRVPNVVRAFLQR